MKSDFYKSLRGKFLIITLLMSIVVAIVTSLLSYTMFTENLQNNQLHSAESNLQFMRNTINDGLNDVKELAEWSCSNDYIINYIKAMQKKDNYSALMLSAYERLAETYISKPASSYISRIVIANTESNKFIQCTSDTLYAVDKNMVRTLKSLPYYNELLESSLYSFSIGVQQDPFRTHKDLMLPVIRPIFSPYNNDIIGFCYIQISLDMFIDPLQEYSIQEGIPVYLTISDKLYKITEDSVEQMDCPEDTVLYNTNSISTQNTQVHKTIHHSKYSYYVTSSLLADGCYISIPVQTQDSAFSDYFYILLTILLLVGLIGIFLFIFLSRTVGQPVNLLKAQLKLIAQGNFEQNPAIEWDNEFGEIGHHVNQLATDIDLLMKQRIEFENQKKDYEYQMLQSQINPHFLYNTLNSIKWMAIAQKANGIAEMTTSLAHLLKNISKGTSSIISIRSEIVLLNDYFTIQKYRYGGSITLCYHINDDTLLDNQILRFTLQPIVENAIFHGIEPKGQKGQIDIYIYKNADSHIEIDVKDNGIGMSDDKIRQVLSDESLDHSSFFKQIGIGSVNKRLQYNFGTKYGLSIESIPGEFTIMKIVLPEKNLK